ncbi:ABC transporter ATP-binding protein [Streptomyces sp. NPDC005953]|uniref:ABC transporter ATP-binding protein n=1 Tax=Streptomyces sp. NPDC005953 TaxID=3156719 RepID=UPI0033D2EE94
MPTDVAGTRTEPVRALSLRGVSKRYGTITALDEVDLDIAEGEIVGLLGHNGAGKTTLMSLVAGLLRPDAGEIEVLGVSPARDRRGARRGLGLAPQELGVYPPLTVRHNLRFFAELAGLRGKEVRRRTEEVAEPLGLTSLLERRVSQLSGGEQRRVHTAMALLHRPKLLLLDEPTAGVDVETRARLIAFVREMAATGTAVCYSTHYLAEVEALDASVAVLDHGRMIARGPLKELVRRHGDSAVELTFIGEPPELSLPWPVTRTADALRVHVEHPQLAAPDVLASLGEAALRLVNLRVVQPSLESVFLRLTGRRYAGESPDAAPSGANPLGDVGAPVGETAELDPKGGSDDGSVPLSDGRAVAHRAGHHG